MKKKIAVLAVVGSAAVVATALAANINCDGLSTCIGTSQPDTITAHDNAVTIWGLGDPNASGGAPGAGDHINAGNGTDMIDDDGSCAPGTSGCEHGENQNDGNDNTTAGDGTDTAWLEGGNDTLHLGNGTDTVYGGTGSKNIVVGDGTDTVYAGTFSNPQDSGCSSCSPPRTDGFDTVQAGNGKDTIYGGNGGNKITTGSGSDTVTTPSGTQAIQTGDMPNSSTKVTVGSGGTSSNPTTIKVNNGTDSVTLNSGGTTSHYKVQTGDGKDTVDASQGGQTDTIECGGNNTTTVLTNHANHYTFMGHCVVKQVAAADAGGSTRKHTSRRHRSNRSNRKRTNKFSF